MCYLFVTNIHILLKPTNHTWGLATKCELRKRSTLTVQIWLKQGLVVLVDVVFVLWRRAQLRRRTENGGKNHTPRDGTMPIISILSPRDYCTRFRWMGKFKWIKMLFFRQENDFRKFSQAIFAKNENNFFSKIRNEKFRRNSYRYIPSDIYQL